MADDYPSRAVKIIVPFGAGGPTDVYTRAIAEELRKSLHQPFIMENRPGPVGQRDCHPGATSCPCGIATGSSAAGTEFALALPVISPPPRASSAATHLQDLSKSSEMGLLPRWRRRIGPGWSMGTTRLLAD